MSVDLMRKLREINSHMNRFGIPVPLVRDPKTGMGSVSLTLVFISFNAVLIGLVGRWSGFFGGIDINQALNLFYACSALYWGRKFTKDSAPTHEPLEKAHGSQRVDLPG